MFGIEPLAQCRALLLISGEQAKEKLWHFGEFYEITPGIILGPKRRTCPGKKEVWLPYSCFFLCSCGNSVIGPRVIVLADMGIPDPARVITTAAIDVHLPNNPSQLPSSLVSADAVLSSCLQRTGSSVSEASTTTVSRTSFSARQHSVSSHTLGSTTDCSSTVREASTSTDYSDQRCYPPPYSSPLALGTQPRGSPSAVVQELLSSLSEDSCLTQKGLDPVNLKPPSPAGSTKTSPELEHRLNIYNKRNQESRVGLHSKPLIHLQSNEPLLEEKYRMMEPVDTPVSRLSET